MKTVVVIPARGGSKRLKGKNLRMLGGKSLIAHSIEYALTFPEFIDKIFVSTDDPEIRRAALEYGVEVIERPEILSTDTATSVSVLKHTLDSISETVDDLILLQPTNPLRPPSLLREALDKYRDGKFDSLLTVSPLTMKLGKIINNRFSPYNYKIGERSQDIEPLFFENGLLYIASSSVIRDERIIGANHFPFIVEHPFSMVDIDTEEDMLFAEILLQKMKV